MGFVGVPKGSPHVLLGSLLMLLAVCCWSAYTLLSRSIKETDTLLATSVSTFIGSALLMPIGAIDMYYHGMPEISLRAWACMAYLAVFASALAYFLYNRALESLPAAQVGNFLNLNPVIGAVIAMIFLKDTFTGWQMAGGVLVLSGIWLSSKRVSQKQ